MNQLNLFLESIKSEETRRKYSLYLDKYFEFAGSPTQPKQIESKIIEFIIFLKKQGKSYYAISNYIAPVKTFYIVNDVLLN